MVVLAYVLVKMKPGTSKEMVGSRLIKGVQMAHSVLGRYDAVLVIKADDLKGLSKIIYDLIEKHPNVVGTETLLALFYPAKEEKPPKIERPPSVISHHCPSCHNLVEVGAPFCHFCGFRFEK
ncbi:MAG: Lrp/AsnC ligand binding domain-containing protein [Thaumarchaeota archaeon]|nr:Lrp/AsnC ligand binding domain-containing protein [Nitrososphaerota archaeon]